MLCSLAAVELIGTDFPADVAVSTVISAGHAFVQNLRRGHYELAPRSIPGIGSRLPSPSWHSPSDLGATGGDAMRRSHQSNRTLCNSFHYCDR